MNPATNLGPLVTASHRSRVLGYIDKGKQRGREARVRRRLARFGRRLCQSDAVHGREQRHDHRPGGDLRPGGGGHRDRTASRKALKVANDSIYGLAASVWTRDLTVAHKTVRDLEAGVIWVNCFDHGDMTQPFGGYKQSGQGRDKCVESLISYTQTKSAWINLG